MSHNFQGIEVKVKFYASLREKIGVDEKVLLLKENDTFPFLLDMLKEVLGKNIGAIINDEGKLKDSVLVGLNGKLINPSDLTTLRLSSGDKVDLMPLPSGG